MYSVPSHCPKATFSMTVPSCAEAKGGSGSRPRPSELLHAYASDPQSPRPDEVQRLVSELDWGPSAPYWVEADMSRLQQVFWNLLKNAIKFTPCGGCVGIRCRPDGTQVVIEVHDSGIGIEIWDCRTAAAMT